MWTSGLYRRKKSHRKVAFLLGARFSSLLARKQQQKLERQEPKRQQQERKQRELEQQELEQQPRERQVLQACCKRPRQRQR